MPDSLRFRKEDEFYVINIRWANTFNCDNEIAEFLINKQKSNNKFNINSMIGNNQKTELLKLISKEAVTPMDKKLQDLLFSNEGCSIDPNELTKDALIFDFV